MTPHQLRLKILAARQETLRRLRSDFKLTPWITPDPELLAVLDDEAAAVQATILDLQREREAADKYCGEK